jgi:hypothetical protein
MDQERAGHGFEGQPVVIYGKESAWWSKTDLAASLKREAPGA